jgi:hypothetical protein
MKVYSWSRNGWNSSEKQVKNGFKNKLPYIRPEFDFGEEKTPISLLKDTTPETVDDLPMALRYVYESPTEFYITPDAKLMKIVDPITQVYKYNEFGNNSSEQDDDYKEDLRKIAQYYEEIIMEQNQEDQVEIARLAFQQEVDRLFDGEETSEFNTERYTAPNTRFEFIFDQKISTLSSAREKREDFFINLFKEVSDCNMTTLYGPIDPIEGKRCFEDGVMGRISAMYHHDKEICQEWSVYDTYDKEGNLVKESALNQQVREFVLDWRENNKGCEESLRRQLNWRFLNTNEVIPPEYDDNGDLIQPTIKIKDSRFHRQRGKAMEELFLTKAQWAGIYQLLDLIKSNNNRHYKTDEELDAEIILVKGLEKCQSLEDLGHYRYQSEKRNFIYKVNPDGTKTNTYKFIPSLVDQLNSFNQIRWWNLVVQKHRELLKEYKQQKWNMRKES